MDHIHWGAILVAAVLNFIVGWLWYGPLFGKAWMRFRGESMPSEMTPDIKKQMWKGMVINFVGQVLSVFVFFMLATTTGVVGFGALLSLALWIWVGFQLTILVGSVLWEKRPWSLFWLNGFYQLAILVVTIIVYDLWH